jgi:hypothetical protein
MINNSCIFVVIKNEHQYLDDWLKYHLDIGVNHLFVFEDVDSKTHKDITDKYDNVTLNNIGCLFDNINEVKSQKGFQKKYIKRGLSYIKNNFNYDWCFVLDADEFITVKGDLPTILDRYKDYDALILQWENYGCSGHIKKPIYDKPIWEIYTEKCGYTTYDRKYCKCTKVCYNMNTFKDEFVIGNHVALCRFVKPDFSRNFGKPVFGDIYIRHYITKSYEEYLWKLNERGMMYKNHRGINDFFEMHPQLNEDIVKEIYSKNK